MGKRTIFAAAALAACAAVTNAQQPAGSYCGAPLVTARLTAISQQVTPDMNRDKAANFMSLMSQNAVAGLKAALGTTTQEEDRATTLFREHAPFITKRIPFSELRATLAAGALLSPDEKARQSSAQPQAAPAGALYGTGDCVSLTVGPAQGDASGGDVVIRINPYAGFAAWAVAAGPEDFLAAHKTSSPSDAALAYGAGLTVSRDWQEFMSLIALSALRAQSETERKRGIDALVGQTDPESFWKLAAASYFASLHAQVDTSLSLDYAQSIEMPAAELQQALAWPEAAKWQGKLKEAR
jgi:hypothetical protein